MSLKTYLNAVRKEKKSTKKANVQHQFNSGYSQYQEAIVDRIMGREAEVTEEVTAASEEETVTASEGTFSEGENLEASVKKLEASVKDSKEIRKQAKTIEIVDKMKEILTK